MRGRRCTYLHHPLADLPDVVLSKVEKGGAIQGASVANSPSVSASAPAYMCAFMHTYTKAHRREGRSRPSSKHAAEDAAVVGVVLLGHAHAVVHGVVVSPALWQWALQLCGSQFRIE